jgi:hypothetical protein
MPEVDSVTETIINLGFNGGAFGVLVVIAIFLMRNLPKWIEDHMQTLQNIAKTHKEEVEIGQRIFSKELAVERSMCDRHHDNVIKNLEKSNENVVRAFDKIDTKLDGFFKK